MATSPKKASLVIAKFVADPADLALSGAIYKKVDYQTVHSKNNGTLQIWQRHLKTSTLKYLMHLSAPTDLEFPGWPEIMVRTRFWIALKLPERPLAAATFGVCLNTRSSYKALLTGPSKEFVFAD